MADFSVDGQQGIAATFVGVAIYFARMMIRRGAKDVSEISSEASQASYLKSLLTDNEKLRNDISVLAKERNDALSKVGALEARLEILEENCRRKAIILDGCPVIDRRKKPRD